MLLRILAALALGAALLVGVSMAFLRTDAVGNDLCAYAVATVQEATSAKVRVDRCSVEPGTGELTIHGLEVGEPGGRVHLEVLRVFVRVAVRPLLQRIRLERLEVDHPRLVLALDEAPELPQAPKTQQCLPDALDRFELGRVVVRRASVQVRKGGMLIDAPRVSAWAHEDGSKLRLGLSTGAARLDLPGKSVPLLSTRTAAQLDLRGAGAVELSRSDVIASDFSLFLRGTVQDLCKPQVDAQANVRVESLENLFSELGLKDSVPGIAGSASADASFSLGRAGPRVEGDLHTKGLVLLGLSPGEVFARFRVDPKLASVERLRIPIGRGAVEAKGQIGLAQPGLPLRAEANLREVELGELLEHLGVSDAPVAVRMTGRVSGHGTLSPPALTTEESVDLSEFAVLDRSFHRRRKGAEVVEFGRGHLNAQAKVTSRAVTVDRGDLELSGSHLLVRGLLEADSHGQLDLHASASGLDLQALRGHIGSFPWAGTVALDAHVHGPYRDFAAEADASARALRFEQLDLGDVSTRLRYGQGTLQLDQIAARRGETRYGGSLSVGLLLPQTPLSAKLQVHAGRVHDLIGLSLGLVPSLRPLESAQDVDGELSADLAVAGPAAEPDGTAQIQLGSVRLFGQSFDSGEAQLSLHGREPRLSLDRMRLRKGRATLAAHGDFGPRYALDFRASSEGLDLSHLDAGRPVALEGPLHLAATVAGTSAHPRLDVQARIDRSTAGRSPLGSGELALELDGDRMSWRGQLGQHQMRGQATLLDDFPFETQASLRFPDLRPLLESQRLLAVRAGTAALELSAHGDLRHWRAASGSAALTRLHLELPDELAIDQDGPGRLTFGPDGVHIEHLALRAPYTSAVLVGSRGALGQLDLHCNASVDGRLIQALVPDVERAAGTYAVQAAITGTDEAPSVLGNLRVEGADLRLRNVPLEAQQLRGSISFSQDALVIDELSGRLNDGPMRLSGGMELASLSPRKLDFALHVEGATFRPEADLQATLTRGDLSLFGPPREPILSGRVELSQMRFVREMDVERSLLDFSRRPPTPRVLVKSPVVVHLDVDVHLGRGVRIENNLARADLAGDLKVTGTSRNLGLLGAVSAVHGTAQFRGNELQIEQGLLSFTDPSRIRPSFDVLAASQVKEYKVKLHAFGTPAEPHLSLSSEPSLSEADLGFLLTFGFVSSNLQQASFNAENSGLALGVEALSKVTGFSDEVRRVIPKNEILRDPTFDFTTDFSTASNQLEPMARFRSHLLTDKLDLRVLEGLTTRRYRGLLAYQLNDSLSWQLQLDNEHLNSGTDFDFGTDFSLRWEGE